MQSRSPKMREAAGLPSKSQDTEKTLRAAPVPTWTQGAARTWARGLQEGSSGGQGWLGLCVLLPSLLLPLSYSCSCPIPVSILPPSSSCPRSCPCPCPIRVLTPVLSLSRSFSAPLPASAPVPVLVPSQPQPLPGSSYRPGSGPVHPLAPPPPARPQPVPLLLQAVPELRQGQRGQLLLRHGASWQRLHGGQRREERAGRLAELPTAVDRFRLFLCLLAPTGFSRSHSFCRVEVFTNPSRGNAPRPVLREPAPRQHAPTAAVQSPGGSAPALGRACARGTDTALALLPSAYAPTRTQERTGRFPSLVTAPTLQAAPRPSGARGCGLARGRAERGAVRDSLGRRPSRPPSALTGGSAAIPAGDGPGRA